MANVEAMYQTLEEIRLNPDGWNQSGWSTCFAGITLRLAGYTFDEEYGDATSPSGERESIEEHAAALLCLDFNDSTALFHGWNSFGVLEEIVANIAAGRPANEEEEYDEEEDDEDYYEEEEED